MIEALEYMNTTIVIQLTNEDRKKRDLRELILKNKEKLIKVVTKCEMLRVELDMVRQEYSVRVGQLFHKSNQQDLDIIYFRNLIQLIDQGKSYDEAVKELDDTYYAQQRKLEQEREQMRRAQEIYEKRQQSQAKPIDKTIKNLWKQLVSKFHPDLVQDEKEKKRREKIMKQLNQAYEEQNIEALKNMENNSQVENIEESTIEKLTQILEDTENQIIEQEAAYQDLKDSEWYRWKTNIARAKKRKKDVFLDIERTLLNEIVRKIETLNELREKVEKMK
ncbi:MAG TPA: J domain-containing protein [Candidatus Levybacteria bacterium]|nr:J domain-containing protein [Candidatus Levybacteria bacterium]